MLMWIIRKLISMDMVKMLIIMAVIAFNAKCLAGHRRNDVMMLR